MGSDSTTRAYDYLASHPWVIDPTWLPALAALALRERDAAEVEALRQNRRAGATPGAQIVDGVGILPITGPLFPRANMMTEMSGATSLQMLSVDLRAMLEDGDVGAIMLSIDSPGGAVAGVAELADQIYRARAKKPIAAFVQGAAASAAYWLAAQAGEIILDRTGIVGSIGVVTTVGKQVEPDANGERRFTVVSSNAGRKVPDVETEEGRADVVEVLDAIEKSFIEDVARGRGLSVKTVRSDFGQGGVKVGSEAVSAKMGDRVSTMEAALARMAKTVKANRRMKELAG